jgi:hypothetical protein
VDVGLVLTVLVDMGLVLTVIGDVWMIVLNLILFILLVYVGLENL